MKVLYLGYAVSRREAENLYGVSIAGNSLQLNLLEQFALYPELEIKAITIYPVAAYPKEKLWMKRTELQLFEGLRSIRIGFLNLPILKQLVQTISTYREASKIVKSERIKTVLTFNLFPQVGLPAKWLKLRYGCKLISLLADLPIDDRVGKRSKGYLVLRKCFDRITLSLFSYYDKFITLNKHAVELFAPGKDYIVMEGGVDSAAVKGTPDHIKLKQRNKSIVYSGALEEYSGIIDLMRAMKYVNDPKVTLDIYGKGHLEKFISRYAEKQTNIIYHGSVSHEAMKRIQEEAYLLVNPRPVEHPIAKVTFPSKLLEYMLSGTPVLTTKLNGLTDEYMDKMYFFDANVTGISNSKNMAYKIDEIMKLPVEELEERAIMARQFLIEEKTWKKQCDKIVQFMKAG